MQHINKDGQQQRRDQGDQNGQINIQHEQMLIVLRPGEPHHPDKHSNTAGDQKSGQRRAENPVTDREQRQPHTQIHERERKIFQDNGGITQQQQQLEAQ